MSAIKFFIQEQKNKICNYHQNKIHNVNMKKPRHKGTRQKLKVINGLICM